LLPFFLILSKKIKKFFDAVQWPFLDAGTDEKFFLCGLIPMTSSL
jgi:hypothetical protein